MKRTMQEQITELKKLDAGTFSETVQKAKTLGYLVSITSQVIQRNELEQRLDQLEKQLADIKGTNT